MTKLKGNKGFTLVELMIVVVILGILVAVAVPVYGAIKSTSEKRTCDTNSEIIEKAATQYLMNTEANDVLGIFLDGGDSAEINSQDEAREKLSPEYLNCFDGAQFPKCPSGGHYTITANTENENRTISVYCSVHHYRNR